MIVLLLLLMMMTMVAMTKLMVVMMIVYIILCVFLQRVNGDVHTLPASVTAAPPLRNLSENSRLPKAGCPNRPSSIQQSKEVIRKVDQCGPARHRGPRTVPQFQTKLATTN